MALRRKILVAVVDTAMKRIGKQYLAIALSLFAFGMANGDERFTADDEAVAPPLYTVVDEVSRIARVKILERTLVTRVGLVQPGEVLSPDKVCGYYYRASVVDGIKGGDQEFSFFSAVDADFQGYDRDYLVFAYKRNPDEYLRKIDEIKGALRISEESRLKCKAFGEYYVPVQQQLFRAFDPEASKRFGGEWLAPLNRPAVVLCADLNGKQKTGFYVSRKMEKDNDSSWVQEWTGVRSFIESAIWSRYKFWNDWIGGFERIDGC